MLRIRRVVSYSVPRYPRVVFRPYREPAALTMIKRGATSAALLAFLESCDTVGTTGPPPIRPELLTENEARSVITEVFGDNGIPLVSDVSVSIGDGQGGTTDVVLDGYNESMRIGYEYVIGDDVDTFTVDLVAQLEEDAAGSGPYIKATAADSSGAVLEQLMQAFIDTLKANGKI